MTRKLFSMSLCAFALLLLMGAGPAPKQNTSILAEEESAVLFDQDALETETQSNDKVSSQAVPAAAGVSPLALAKETESGLMIDGAYATADVALSTQKGVSYVALSSMAKELDGSAQSTYESGTVTVTTNKMKLTATVGQTYLEANGRYLYLPDKVQMSDGRVIVPLRTVAMAFDAEVNWDADVGVIKVTRGSGAIQSGSSYYDQDQLFWLSRVITAESGNQPMEGQIAVGNVIMNRVNSPVFPNTIKGVLAQKNQFTTYKNGKLADRTPYSSSVIAAKLVLDGAVVEKTEGAFYFNSSNGGWVAKNKECVAVIGAHKFYR